MANDVKSKQPVIQDIPKPEKNAYHPSAAIRFILFGIPITGFIAILFLWSEFYKPKVIDDWYLGVTLVDSATKITDPILQKSVMEQGGNILRHQNRLHHYHARVWSLLGHYYLVTSQLDSCIYTEKKAIEIGAGGVVNRIEFLATEHINAALERKLTGIHSLDSSIRAIDDAATPEFMNNTLYKFKGFTYYNYNQTDSAIANLEQFYSRNNNDFDDLYVLALSYARKGMKDKALFYGTEARKIKGDHPNLNNLMDQLNAR